MKRTAEKNIKEFNKDVKKTGGYQYTDFKKYSAFIATKRQTDEINKLLRSQEKKNYKILDVGCGDGTFTFEILEEIKPHKLVGFDMARTAVTAAKKRIKAKDRKKITFTYCNVYDVSKKFSRNSFDIIVVRGVLHHLYDPQKAINELCKVSNKIIVLEPNGYNPLLKIIEKLSPYHVKHEERSYWPPTLNSWFIKNNFIVRKQLFCGIVPYFFPEIPAKLLKGIEPVMERLPFVKNFYCGTNVVYFERSKQKNR